MEEAELDNQNYIITPPNNYRVAYCPQLGRFLEATRDIKKGEIILKDQPLVIGPIKSSSLICPGCYQLSPESKCEKCGWPICDRNCIGLKSHQELECKLLQTRHVQKPPSHDYNALSDFLMIIRCLLLKRVDPRKWSRLLEMETNWEKWIASPLSTGTRNLEVHLFSKYSISSEEFPSSEIMKVQAILDINSYEVQLPDSNSIQALYQLASLAEHSCLPNTHKTISNDNLELVFRAATDIPRGEHISTTYCDILWPTWHRQQFLQWSKFFICACPRCHSPSELDSHLGSILCMDCLKQQQNASQIAAALPIIGDGWTTISKDYQCTICKVKLPAYECQLLSKKAGDELTHLDKYASTETLSTFEAWLNKWTLLDLPHSSSEEEQASQEEERQDEADQIHHINSSREQIEIPKRKKEDTCYTHLHQTLLLHPQHSLVLDCCHTLFLLYPKEDSTLNQLRRKERVGAHLLQATKSLFTGISKFRGTTSYELAMTKASILVHQLEQSGVTDNLQLLAEEVLQLLVNSQEMLKYEPTDQPEGRLAQAGESQLEQLTMFFAEIFPTLNRPN